MTQGCNRHKPLAAFAFSQSSIAQGSKLNRNPDRLKTGELGNWKLETDGATKKPHLTKGE
jgi:hypothetical protein